MIRYDLKCDKGHTFDSWFAGAAAYDRLAAAGHVACPDCGSTRVEKALMAPSLTKDKALSAPRDPREEALADLRRQVEENSDYVGLSFAAEARAMHEGRIPERAIHGEAKLDEARKLIEDGVPVAPLPFMPARKTN
ncbi:DUF1178 family protein [Gemmobacter nectariphilus]|uniref:DUF1178 family protein n=1 Tax=Gemmobacter nectariphilus TaxID=220343 RepID=UPI000427D246|nr:DUF1178 family protein [Gemmobacter nectariphilus]